MKYYRATVICRQVLAEILEIEQRQIPLDPWLNIFTDFAAIASCEGWSGLEVDSIFRIILNQWVEKKIDLRHLRLFVQQLHYEYFVNLNQRKEKLTPEENDNYQTAIVRKRAGVIKPLEEKENDFTS